MSRPVIRSAVRLKGSKFSSLLLVACISTAQSAPATAAERVTAPDDARDASILGETAHPRPQPPIRLAQSTGNLTVKVLIDSKKNRDYVKADDQFASFVYEATTSGDITKIQLASKDIVGVWKGSATIVEVPFAGKSYFDSEAQFAPVFVVAEVRNDGTRAAQVTGAYLDVALSATDFQPYLDIGDWGRLHCNDGSYAPSFQMLNFGWGPVRNGKLVYTFGTKSARSSELIADLGTFDERTTATVDDGVRQSGADIARLKAGKFKCSSKSQVPACLAQLKGSGVLGRLANYVTIAEGNRVQTTATGSIEYDWIDSDNKTNHRSSPFSIVIPILFFEVGGGPECGAPGPVDRDEKPVALSLDRQNYRIPLGWSGPLASRQTSRFALSLTAPKASHHVLKLVLTLADGGTVSSGPIDISYFTPRMPSAPPDDPDEKK